MTSPTPQRPDPRGSASAADVLGLFSESTATWFAESFAAPTAAQAGAWRAVAGGGHALVVAPTGSGKTLAAFLWALDRLRTDPTTEDRPRCRVLYISPLKALAADVERNLRSPLIGISRTAARLGLPSPEIRVGMRTGDTPASQRRALVAHPPDILITTPESLFLMLTSAARESLAGVETVILDEVHVMAGSKRGAHLALSLERLDALLPAPAQRVGLSATVRPLETVGRFLTGTRPLPEGGRHLEIVAPRIAKEIRIDLETSVPDLTRLADDAPAPAAQEAVDAPPGPWLAGSAAGRLPSEPETGGAIPSPSSGLDGGSRSESTPSIWPHVTRQVVDIIAAHRTTLVFTDSRRGAERLTARLNEEWERRTAAPSSGGDPPAQAHTPGQSPALEQATPLNDGATWAAQAPGQSGTSLGVPGRIARAHHGSVSLEERRAIEEELKSGLLPAVVATSSLELGIDMGSIDVVVQVGAPHAVSSLVQRLGRAGHQVGAVSRAVVIPVHRGELLPAAVLAERARSGQIEEVHPPEQPLDVLAQQIVAMCADREWTLGELAALIRRASPYQGLGTATLEAVLDMLAGRYPSEDFASLRPRLVWDRVTDTLTARPGAQRLAVTSGGTIPDRGLYGVFLAAGSQEAAARGGRRVGELDEEMVFESRVGDTFTLGTSTWRIEQITPDRVLVSPAPGLPGRLPFWKGDAPGRDAELGEHLGRRIRETLQDPRGITAAVAEWEASAWTRDNTAAYLREQLTATDLLPTDETIVIERFKDDLGDWRVVIHSPYGAKVHAPWALVIAERLRERLGTQIGVMPADDGIVLRLPDTGDVLETWEPIPAPEPSARGRDGVVSAHIDLADLLLDPGEVRDAVVAGIGSSAHFAGRFREAAARALLLPRRRAQGRSPLWQQRQRASQLLAVAAQYPDFPIVLEAVRESIQDDFDTDALADLMARISRREIRVVEVTTPAPSPFARSLLMRYVGAYLYDGDAPLADRRAAALTLDPELLAELLGAQASDLADLLDPEAVDQVERQVALLTAGIRDVEGVADAVRRLGPITTREVARRLAATDDPETGTDTDTDAENEGSGDEPGPARAAAPAAAAEPADQPAAEVVARAQAWLSELEAQRRIMAVRVAGVEQWAVVEDAARLRDALGIALPMGLPGAVLEAVTDPLGDLVRRHARSHGPFLLTDLAERFALAPGALTSAVRALLEDGTLQAGRIRPGTPAPDHPVPWYSGRPGSQQLCDVEVVRRMRRRSLTAARAEVEAVPAEALGTFAPRWHRFGALRGVDGVLEAVDQLAGVAFDLADLESSVLPARVVDYRGDLLDDLTTSGEVVWVADPQATSASPAPAVTLLPSDAVAALAPEPREVTDPLAVAVLDALNGGGRFFRDIVQAVRQEAPDTSAPDVERALWELVEAGQVSNDSLAPLRARASATRAPTRSAPARRRLSRRALLAPSALDGGRTPGHGRPERIATPPTAAGRWSAVERDQIDPATALAARVATMVQRHGVLLRGAAGAEGVPGGYSALYPSLVRLEEAGGLRRGYLVEGQGASQFALPECIDRLRADAQRSTGAVVIAAQDPANPYGSLLPWPEHGSGRARRVAGADVVLVDGRLVLFLERGGGSLLTFTHEEEVITAAATQLGRSLASRAVRVTIRRMDGDSAAASTGTARRALVSAGFVPGPSGLRAPRSQDTGSQDTGGQGGGGQGGGGQARATDGGA
ncbi:DEAD/DEAH box helicase [Serinibacter salmoneus]|uniref:ATP-dependent Lhr-like helicase n=1 Tax=Serinibacter salmoneus TaxID=556530 RepID=A0A2A9CYZ9_9MICO|nr:DEAD/DEAH box helicase [Serinibacter salmoneus]PFG19351.1 ATP-dependent Lhr-like helicase [Serinibacter salmoneus]